MSAVIKRFFFIVKNCNPTDSMADKKNFFEEKIKEATPKGMVISPTVPLQHWCQC